MYSVTYSYYIQTQYPPNLYFEKEKHGKRASLICTKRMEIPRGPKASDLAMAERGEENWSPETS